MAKDTFYPFQRSALTKWRKNEYRGGIFFEPGLGKSYISQHALKMLFKAKKVKLSLILVPAIIVDMWESDLEELGFVSGDDMLIIRAGVMQEHVNKYLETHTPKIIVTTYTLFRARTYPRPDIYICDESHNLKNPDSKALRALIKVIRSTDKVLLLSGTPIPSGVEDFFSQFMLIKPGYLAFSIREFRMRFERLKYKGSHTYLPLKEMLPVLRNMVSRYASFKKAVDAIELPPVTHTTVRYPLSQKQLGAMELLRNEGYALNEEEGEEEQVRVESPAIRMLLLQQMCSGFASMNIKEAGEGIDIDLSTGMPVKPLPEDEIRIQINLDLREDIDTPLHKEELLVHDLENLCAVNQRALIWINFTKTAEKLAAVLKLSPTLKTKFAVITGKTSLKKRREILDAYDRGEIMYLIAHPKTLGTGLNRFSGNTQYIFWYELTPDFALVEQANGRIYRKGQELPVFIKYYIATGNSVEKHIQKIVETKGNLKDMMFKGYLKILK